MHRARHTPSSAAKSTECQESVALVDNASEASSGVAKPVESLDVPLSIAFYNIGLLPSQVQSEKLYNKWVLRNLRRDVRRMVNEYHMDVICLCEIGGISGNIEGSLSHWMIHDSASTESQQCPRMQKMLRQLVDDAPEWQVYAMAHYGLLINSTTVELIEEPILVGLYKPQPRRVAMKFKIAPAASSVGKPALATEIWNVHSPSSDDFNFGIDARR